MAAKAPFLVLSGAPYNPRAKVNRDRWDAVRRVIAKHGKIAVSHAIELFYELEGSSRGDSVAMVNYLVNQVGALSYER